MSRDNTQPGNSQMTARVVEEGYLSLQKSLQNYRRARDHGVGSSGLDDDEDPTIKLQDAVQSFNELIRPFVKDEPRLAEYWEGAVASYPEQPMRPIPDSKRYYREQSIGVWQVQRHEPKAIPRRPSTRGSDGSSSAAVADGGESPQSLEGWHKALGLPPTTRLLSVNSAGEDDPLDGWYVYELRCAVVGLNEIATWGVTERTERTRGSGFMAGETSERTIREPEPDKKVETAARMLIEVAHELGAIASFEPGGDRISDIPRPNSGGRRGP